MHVIVRGVQHVSTTRCLCSTWCLWAELPHWGSASVSVKVGVLAEIYA